MFGSDGISWIYISFQIETSYYENLVDVINGHWTAPRIHRGNQFLTLFLLFLHPSVVQLLLLLHQLAQVGEP